MPRDDAVPPEKVEEIMKTVKERVKAALKGRLAPRAVYNRIAAPDLTAMAPDENWSQPLSLMQSAAGRIRDAFTDPRFRQG